MCITKEDMDPACRVASQLPQFLNKLKVWLPYIPSTKYYSLQC